MCVLGGGPQRFLFREISRHSEAARLIRSAVRATPVEDLQTRRTLAGDQPHLKGRRNLGDKPTIHHHDPGGRMGVFVVGEAAAAAAQFRSSRAVGRPAGRPAVCWEIN